MSFASMLNCRVRIEGRASSPSSATRYPVHGTSQVQTNVPAGLQPGASRTLLERGKRSVTTPWTLYVHTGVSVGSEATVTCEAGPAGVKGRVFRVVGEAIDAAGRGHHLEALLEENRP